MEDDSDIVRWHPDPNASPNQRLGFNEIKIELSSHASNGLHRAESDPLLDSKLAGLTTKEVEQLRAEFGFNEIPAPKKNPVVRFLRKFVGVTPGMLELTIVVALALQNWLNACVIFILLCVNSVLSFREDLRAEAAVEELMKKLQIFARALRDGERKHIPSRELVPGDVIRVRMGDLIPADVKILEGTMEADQSAITGETRLITLKPGGPIGYAGSVIKKGEATALVTATGSKTFNGKSMQLVRDSKPILHSEEVIRRLVYALLVLVVTIIVVAIIVLLVKGEGDKVLVPALPLILILLVSAIPVALPTMFTVAMALGSKQLTAEGVLVCRLNATEDAASMTVLCTDKTGTLTKNELTVRELTPVLAQRDAQEILLMAVQSQKRENHEAIDNAIIEAAEKAGIVQLKQEHYTPFSAAIRRTEAVVKMKVDGKEEAYVKCVVGAVNTLSHLAKLSGDDEHTVSDLSSSLASRGFRVLGVLRSEPVPVPPPPAKFPFATHDWQYRFMGLISLHDPLREDSREVVQTLIKQGIRVKMLTGDSTLVARETGRAVGLGPTVVNCKEQRVPPAQAKIDKKDGGIDELSPDLSVDATDVFGEVFPQDKHAIVSRLQARKEIVGMTGDGVNDAPSLKKAEVGCAMNNATDVAKQAASAVLTKDGLSGILSLIRVGRQIHARIENWIVNKVIKTFQTVVFIVVAFLIMNKFIVTAFDQVLLLFLIDFVTVSMATDRVVPGQRPQEWAVFRLAGVSAIVGIMVVAESIGLLYFGWVYWDLQHAATDPTDDSVLNALGLQILFYYGISTPFIVRERRHFYDSRPSATLFWCCVIELCIMLIVFNLGIVVNGTPIIAKIAPEVTFSVLGLTLGANFLLNDLVKSMAFKFVLQE